MNDWPKLPLRFRIIDGMFYFIEAVLLVLMIVGAAALIMWIIREAL
jgi:hypothetical protein